MTWEHYGNENFREKSTNKSEKYTKQKHTNIGKKIKTAIKKCRKKVQKNYQNRHR
jgi:hypothetical protein